MIAIGDQITALMLAGHYLEYRAKGKVGKVTSVHAGNNWIDIVPISGKRKRVTKLTIDDSVELIKVGPRYWHIRNKYEDLRV